jgi:hypothetical protein
MAHTVADIMGELPPRFTIVFDNAGLPVRLEERGRAYPVLAISPNLPIADLRTDPDLERLLSQGLPGLLVLDGDTLVGVVSAADMVELGRPRTRRAYRAGDSQDTVLPGDSRPMHRRVLVRCRTCGRTNSLEYLLPTATTTCDGGHPLDPDLS